jgi:hypothetical protein
MTHQYRLKKRSVWRKIRKNLKDERIGKPKKEIKLSKERKKGYMNDRYRKNKDKRKRH